jgi:glucokinase
MADGQAIVGIDLGGTNMQVGVVDDRNRVIGRARKKTRSADGLDAVLSRVIDGVKEACDDAGVSRDRLGAVGIGAPGAIDIDRGVVLEAVNLRWNDVPLASILRDRLGVPVVVDNDVNAAVYGEYRLGAGEGARDILGAWVGTGIGGGLILDGRLYHGHFRTAGEFGHMIALPNVPAGLREVEDICSRTAIVERITRLVRTNHPSVLTSMVDDISSVKSSLIAQAYKQQDPVVVRVVDEAAHILGVAVAGVVTLLSLGRVVIGGGLTEAMGEALVGRVRAAVRDNVFPDRCRAVEVVATRLEDLAGVLGAALLARESIGAPATR